MINIHHLKSHDSFSQCALHWHSRISCAYSINIGMNSYGLLMRTLLSDVASICKGTVGEGNPTQETYESQNVDNRGSELYKDVYELKTQ